MAHPSCNGTTLRTLSRAEASVSWGGVLGVPAIVGWLTEGSAAMSISTAVYEVVVAEESVERREMLAVAGFLAGYGGSTRVSFAADLRLFAAWCHEAKLNLFTVRRAHLEL
ncbi:MAG: hypothetical protein QOE07_2145 [Acidimicrobiaceae bacterium]|nr:hypothetical protein [Acidimicrobiaceae bacterium]